MSNRVVKAAGKLQKENARLEAELAASRKREERYRMALEEIACYTTATLNARERHFVTTAQESLGEEKSE